MVNVLASSVVDRCYDLGSGLIHCYEISMCCFSEKYAPLKSKNDDWLVHARLGPGWLNKLGSWTTSLSPIRCGFAPGFVNYKKFALDPQPQVIKFTSCLPMVGGALRALRLLPPLQLVTMI